MSDAQFTTLLAAIKQLDQKFEKRFDTIEQRLDDQDARFNEFANEVGERFEAMDRRFEMIDRSFDKLGAVVATKADAGVLYDKLDTIGQRLDRHQAWIVQLAGSTQTRLMPEP